MALITPICESVIVYRVGAKTWFGSSADVMRPRSRSFGTASRPAEHASRERRARHGMAVQRGGRSRFALAHIRAGAFEIADFSSSLEIEGEDRGLSPAHSGDTC